MNRADIHIKSSKGATLYRETHTAPASWAEMTRKHLIIWAASLSSKLTIELASRIMAAMLYRIPEKLFICIPDNAADDLVKSVKFLFGKNLLSNWLISSIWQGVFKYHGPKNGLANVTIYEFGLCEHCYDKFQLTKNHEYIDTLMAILYRPRRFWGIDDDIRVKLTTFGYVRRAKRFKSVSIGVKVAVLLNYEGCRNALHLKYKEVFTPGKKAKKGAEKQQKPEITPWPKIIEAGANDIFGTLADTKTSNLHDFLSRLNTRNKLQKELEANK
ncbi:hypothetical protein J3L18_05300 [Mucilaginibacter gossypii]|uniref:hypothetical protein n=1 Tax=Mucilaginibacter gossypii TaxID=551996 RepID=UPI000DCC6982|nr:MULTISPECIES: hypothetical protein [Mucilaginibacter]QTE38494.1 hypothetical protein J3L18_05300 [Mucilaginibacter gossypii]RAV55769.1 hypothetical protein DIU36_16895 [Mucilaginibacter rubeus]